MSSKPSLVLENLNPNIKMIEYTVRGPVMTRAADIEEELKQGVKKPFTAVINASNGDCHAMGQAPITYIRQVLALINYPNLLMDDPRFPPDAKERARIILAKCVGGSVGSYSDPIGTEAIRRRTAQYIQRRDGMPSNWEDIVLTEGATEAIKNVLKLFMCDINGKKAGVMVPIPQYPLYSAVLSEFNMHRIEYFLDESKGWRLDVPELQRSIDEAKKISTPRVLVVINPGNPTGHVLSCQNIEEIIKFAHKEKLFLLADEVYQDNIHTEDTKFNSFKKVLTEMGKPYSEVELASFMSCSNGFMAECGIRGGYAEVINMDPKVVAMYFKAIRSTATCTVLGQATLDTFLNPPLKGQPSYEQFQKEKQAILDSLKLRAKMVSNAFNSIEGFSCNPVQGALYAFPQFTIPKKAVEAARAINQEPDVFYALELLESTGICIVPGSEFGQQPGTYHFRTSILPQHELLQTMLDKFREFHGQFIKKYA